jgi:hypothetical protein
MSEPDRLRVRFDHFLVEQPRVPGIDAVRARNGHVVAERRRPGEGLSAPKRRRPRRLENQRRTQRCRPHGPHVPSPVI